MATILIIFCLHGVLGFADFEAPPLMYWSFGEAGREEDGSGYQVLFLTGSSSDLPEAKPEILCRIQPIIWKKDGLKSGEAADYLIEPNFRNGKWQIMVAYPNYARVTVLAKTTINQRNVYAQTSFNLYGKGKIKTWIKAASHNWPEVKLSSDKPIYWPQTGQQFSLAVYPEKKIGQVSVWENNLKITREDSGKTSFNFTPAHDQKLNNQGATAYKEIILELNFEDNPEIIFYTLKTHRPRHDFLKLKPGLMLAGFILVGLIIIIQQIRKRFRYQ